MSETKFYEAEGFSFEFTPNGSPFEGLLMVTTPEATFSAAVNLTKLRSRSAWAKGMFEDYGAEVGRLKRALNEICTLRTGEVAAAERAGQDEDDHPEAEPETLSEEAEALILRASSGATLRTWRVSEVWSKTGMRSGCKPSSPSEPNSLLFRAEDPPGQTLS